MGLIFKIYNKSIVIIKLNLLKIIYKNKINLGKNFSMRKRLNLVVKHDATLIIGDNVFFNNDCSVNCLDYIEIGENCIFGEGVKIYDHNHVFKNSDNPIRLQGYKTKPVRIGKNCWFGSGVIILPGVRVGSNCVIGAGCVIYKDIPDNSIVKNKQELITFRK